MQRLTRRKSPKKITKLRLILQAISLMSMIATRPIYACSLLVLRVQGGIQDLVGLVAGDKCLVFGLPGLVGVERPWGVVSSIPEMLPHSDRFVSLCPTWFQLCDPGRARCLLDRIDYRRLKRLCHTCRRNACCRVVCNVLICISRQFCRLIRGSDECWPGCYIWELAYFSHLA